MRALVVKRFEGTLLVSLSCLSASLFLLLLLLISNLFAIIGNLFSFGAAGISLVIILRSLVYESRIDWFDLTIPTIFDRGLLTFQSQKDKTAVFFAFVSSSSTLQPSNVKRTLTVLLKILPVSTIISFEWSSPEKYFINFFIRLKREDFLTRVQELVESINSSLITSFGSEDIRLLKIEELMTHFSMGIGGYISRVRSGGRNCVLLQSNDVSEKKVVISYGPLERIDVGRIFQEKLDSQQIRIILSAKREENSVRVFDALTVVSNEYMKNFEPSLVVKKPIIKSIRTFGDILTRNLVEISPKTLDYQALAKVVLDQISSVNNAQITAPRQTEQDELTTSVNPMTWRTLLTERSSLLGLPHSLDNLFLIDGIPIRFDAKIRNLIFFIISQSLENQLSWLIDRIATLISSEEHLEIGLLVTNPAQIAILEETLTRSQFTSRIHILSRKEELDAVLKEQGKQAIVDKELITQVA